MNSVVGPIFNIFKCVNNACTAHKQWILSLKVNNYGFKKKKKKKERKWKRAFENADAESKPARNWLILWQNTLYL